MFYWPNIRKFQCWKEKRGDAGCAEEEGEEIDREVSYSVSGDLQIT